MPRARNIKHSFFVSEQVADNAPLGRLLFIGLWTVADFKGDLIWKPRSIKAQLLPFDNCDIEKLAINLDKSGLIRFYSDGVQIYVNITGFCKHQNPHKNEREKGSDIPSYSEPMRQAIDLNTLAINLDKSRLNHDQNGTAPADSLFLIPDSGLLIDQNPDTKKRSKAGILLADYLNDCKAKGEKPISSDDPLFAYCEQAGIPDDYTALAWRVFKDAHLSKSKKYIDWKAAFRNAVKQDWYKLWAIDREGNFYLTTAGKQAEAAHFGEQK